MTTQCWIDIRTADDKAAVIEECAHQGLDAVITDDPADLVVVPPTLRRVLVVDGAMPAPGALDAAEGVDVLLLDPLVHGDPAAVADRVPNVTVGAHVTVDDAVSLDRACHAARRLPWVLLTFRDPTKIALEVVLAAAPNAGGVITVGDSVDDAKVIAAVLEHGPDGVALAPRRPGQATELRAALQPGGGELEMTAMTITGKPVEVGPGERVCIDTTRELGLDEGILVGSYSLGFLLCASETHPLPYMDTRPFRVNAGVLSSYVLRPENRTSYLRELRSGSTVTTVTSGGTTREVTVVRAKMETRPLLLVDAKTPGGQAVNLILQNDWHVRMLSRAGDARPCTELAPGDVIAGHCPPTAPRHVGWAINELCVEQ